MILGMFHILSRKAEKKVFKISKTSPVAVTGLSLPEDDLDDDEPSQTKEESFCFIGLI